MMSHVQYANYNSIKRYRPQYFNITIDLNSEAIVGCGWGVAVPLLFIRTVYYYHG